ncbi:MAG: 50S ribosomal protein L21 [Leptospiraceae bacterium]|nr:50S ribosomal protein L21 [Leptospiraceae bacterium]MCP5499708.1 50S ribosomal protein L21 [Leptospiraceae bacterium]
MYAIIKVGNQQFRVEQDLEFVSQRTGREVGSEFETPALLFAEGNKINVGTPELKDVKVKLQVLEDFRGTKIKGFKYKKRKNYHKSWGHRQELQKLKVVSISN